MKKIYEDSKKIRLDKYLSLNLKHSRTEINKIINSGSVTINSKVITKQSALLKLNDVIVFEEISKDDKPIKINSNFKLNVIYNEDELKIN